MKVAYELLIEILRMLFILSCWDWEENLLYVDAVKFLYQIII
jgi:hypothetical protein